jgi:hypothetical protein
LQTGVDPFSSHFPESVLFLASRSSSLRTAFSAR